MNTKSYGEINVYSNNFTINGCPPHVNKAIENYVNNKLTTWEYKKDWRTRKGEWVVDKLWAVCDNIAGDKYFRFPKPLLPKIVRTITANTNINKDMIPINNMPVPTTNDYDFNLADGWKLRDDQAPVYEYIVKNNTDSTRTVPLRPGAGKGFIASETNIRKPNGWIKGTEIKIGDVVTTPGGGTTTVTGVYDNEDQEMFEITFEDGRVKRCDSSHLWKIFVNDGNQGKHKTCYGHYRDRHGYITVSTEELFILINKSLSSKENKARAGNKKIHNYAIPMVSPTKSPDKTNDDLLIHPHTLGILLAGGKIRPSDVRRATKLYDNTTNNLFIPDEYLNSSHAQKVVFLQGFIDQSLDTDNCKQDSDINGYKLRINSETLAHNVKEMLYSLGYKVYFLHNEVHTIRNGERKKGKGYFTLTIPNIDVNTLSKEDKYKDTSKEYKTRFLSINSIVKKPKADTRCITVESVDMLFVIDDYLVTHNTVISMASCAELKKRVCIIIKPMYIKKWISDVTELTDIPSEEIMVVSGGRNLKAMMEAQKNGEMDEVKIIIISNATMRNYIKEYDKYAHDYEMYGILYSPGEFFEKMDVGTLLFDEVHQDFHLNYKLLSYANVEHVIAMSGTLESLDDFITEMHENAFPMMHRYKDRAYKKYISVNPYSYQFNNPKAIRINSPGDKRYNHNIFEGSVLRNKNTTNNYLAMSLQMFEGSFLKRRLDKEKCVIYFSTVEMCTIATQFYKERLPALVVERYTSEDNYEDMLKADVIISTLGSLGTAIDIPNLLEIILTINVNSIQAVKQVFGRLREIPDREVRCHYPYCDQIPKHVEYHKNRLVILEPMTKEVNEQYIFNKV